MQCSANLGLLSTYLWLSLISVGESLIKQLATVSVVLEYDHVGPWQLQSVQIFLQHGADVINLSVHACAGFY